jgi:hypothetical protein
MSSSQNGAFKIIGSGESLTKGERQGSASVVLHEFS